MLTLSMLNIVRKIQRGYDVLSRRSFSVNRQLLIDNVEFQKFKLKQAKMQCDDGLPVYLKKGAQDRLLFKISIALLLCNTLASVYAIIILH